MKALQEGKQVHANMTISGVEPNVLLGSKLLSMYAKSGNLVDARLVFDKIPERNLFLWNAMMIAYSMHGSCEEVLEFYCHMQRGGVRPNNFTFPCVLKACAGLEALDQGKEIHAFIVKSGFESDGFVGNALVTMYAKCGSIQNARQVFDKMYRRDVVSWNALIAGYAQNGDFNQTVQLFRQMQLEDVKPNSVTIVSVLPACANLAYLRQGKEIHQFISRSAFQTDILVWNALVTLYARCESLDEARKVFDKMPERDLVSWNAMIAGYAQNGHCDEALQLFNQMEPAGVKPNISTWNGMIAGYAQNGRYGEALKLVRQLQLSNEKPNSVTITSVLPACAHIAALQQGMEIHNYVTKGGQLNVFVGTALIDMYAKCGSIEDARQVFDKVSQKNVVLWTAIIAGYAMHGYGEETLALLSEMQQAGMKPDYITFTAVLSACSHAGLVNEGWKCFDCMIQDYHITPMVEHYACMVDLLGRAGRLGEAQDLIKNMPVEPNAGVWGSLLAASRIHCNIELGEFAAEHLFELEPQNIGNFVLLSNIYARAGRLGDVENVRKMMKDRGLKKNPGCSWIEVKNRVHAFVVGDRLHPQTEEIYAMLESLAGQMKQEGYVPETNVLLHDLDEEEYILCSNSVV
eukprot:Gb_02562 [translate_table: standard]